MGENITRGPEKLAATLRAEGVNVVLELDTKVNSVAEVIKATLYSHSVDWPTSRLRNSGTEELVAKLTIPSSSIANTELEAAVHLESDPITGAKSTVNVAPEKSLTPSAGVWSCEGKLNVTWGSKVKVQDVLNSIRSTALS